MFEQTAEWWDSPASDGRRNADLGPTDLVALYGEVSMKGWYERRTRGEQLFGAEVVFGRLKQGRKPWGKGLPASERLVPPEQVLTTEQKVERDREVSRLRASNKDLKAKYDSVITQKNLHDELLALVERYVSASIKPAKIQTVRIGSGHTIEDAILGHADLHAGEIVGFDVMQGFNSYNPQILCRRFQRTIDKTLSLLFDNHSGTTFEHLYAFSLGDGVSGDLLPDNMATNAMSVFESMLFVAQMRARALTELAAYIPVTDVEIPGNHGRRTAKMPWKQPTETADWLIAEMVRMMVADNPRIEVIAPKAWTAVVNVRGWNHSLNHGYSAAKGGYGGIPFYSFQRADGKKTALEQAHDRRVHYRWYGHIHTPAELPQMDGSGTQFIIGSLKGGDEYALEELNTYAEPKQKLVGCHDKYGVTWRYDLQVKHADETPSRYEELIP